MSLRYIGLWDVKTPTFCRQLSHRRRLALQIYAPVALYLMKIYCTTSAIVWLERYVNCKIGWPHRESNPQPFGSLGSASTNCVTSWSHLLHKLVPIPYTTVALHTNLIHMPLQPLSIQWGTEKPDVCLITQTNKLSGFPAGACIHVSCDYQKNSRITNWTELTASCSLPRRSKCPMMQVPNIYIISKINYLSKIFSIFGTTNIFHSEHGR